MASSEASSSCNTCPDMESLVEDTESRDDAGPFLATSLMDLSPEKSEGGLCAGRRRYIKGTESKCVCM